MNRFVPLVATLVCGGAFAQQQQSVEVRAPVRTDVRTLCPDIDNDLQDTLAKTVRQVSASALIDVRFELRGSRIEDVRVGAGPAPYQRALRWAVRGLQCESTDATPQQVTLRVRFVDPFERNGGAVAVLVPASAPAR